VPDLDPDSVARCARLIVDYGADWDNGRPLRVSPLKTEAILDAWVPARVTLSVADVAAMPTVMSAWVRWAGTRTGLPPAAVDTVGEVADEFGEHFAGVYARTAESSRPYLAGVDDSASPAELVDILARRRFVAPFRGTRIGTEDFPYLDPGDPDQRRLLIEGEHPQYHDVLTDPESDELVDGVNPRLHIALHEVAANQIWDNDPPEAWRAVIRLRAAGLDRHEILHRLSAVAAEYIQRAIAQKQDVDAAEYGRALDALSGK
jgi:hypothetical protein